MSILLISALLSYAEWYLQAHELRVVYPLDSTYVTPVEAQEPRLKEMRLTTPDGTKLILCQAAPTPGQPVVLYLSGNSGNLGHRSRRFGDFLDAGYGLIAPAYRGANGSGGKPSEINLTKDIFLIWDKLVLDAPYTQTIVYGESLGAALAVKLAAKREVGAVILEAPFLTLPELISTQLPEVDVEIIMSQIWDTRSTIADVSEPLMIIHGTLDPLVPFAHGQGVFRRAGSEDKVFYQITGAGHVGLWDTAARAHVFAFMDRF